MVMRELFAVCSARLRKAEIPDAATDVRILIDHVMDRGALFCARFPQYEPTEKERCRIEELIERRAAHVPVAYLVGEREFMGLPFYVNEHVLIPRGDTECLIEAALEHLNARGGEAVRILDIGTGSGAIAVSMAKYCKGAQVTGLDISSAALQIAEKNAVRNAVGKCCRFMRCDILNEIPAGKYDIILSNPPYIPPQALAELEPDVRDYEPRGALTDEHDGLDFYRRISRIAPALLECGGMLFFEIGCEQSRDVRAIMEQDGWSGISLRHDLAGRPRVLFGQWK